MSSNEPEDQRANGLKPTTSKHANTDPLVNPAVEKVVNQPSSSQGKLTLEEMNKMIAKGIKKKLERAFEKGHFKVHHFKARHFQA